MKTMKIGVVLLALLLAGMAMVPMVSAIENKNTSIINSERNQIAAQLFGKNITEEEFIKNVFPEIYHTLSDCQKHLYSGKRMNWVHQKMEANSKAGTYSDRGQLLSPPSPASSRELIDNAIAAVVPLTYGSSSISANRRSVYHKSESWIAFPPYLNVPYIGLVSYLIKEQNGQEILVDTTTNARYRVQYFTNF